MNKKIISRHHKKWKKKRRKTSFGQKEKKKYSKHIARAAKQSKKTSNKIKISTKKKLFDLVSHFGEMENGVRCVWDRDSVAGREFTDFDETNRGMHFLSSEALAWELTWQSNFVIGNLLR